MSGVIVPSKHIKPQFASATKKAKPPRKRPPPTSVRFSAEQREQLEADANGVPLGTYLKELAFEKSPRVKKRARTIVQDYELLAQVLSALGKSNVFANMELLAQAADSGKLILDPETRCEIAVACACVLQMRDDLAYSLGLRSGASK